MYNRFGGKHEYKKMLDGEQQMKRASESLPPVYSSPVGLPVYFLTGKKYIHQTLFCIQSLSKVTDTDFKYILVDDGSFDKALVDRIQKQLPLAQIITADVVEKNLDDVLPVDSYPYLRAKREVYPHLRKLTDVHTIKSPDWKLVLDSDMLFWNSPDEMISWLTNPDRPIHMVDCVESYGYTRQLMQQLCECPVPDLLNVGIIGLNSNSIDWTKLNDWIRIMEEKEGSSYYLEQALTAMLIGSTPSMVLNVSDYKVNPSAADDNAILKHYVDLSKKIYFNGEWRRV